jgi:hypothetical protein
LINWQLEFLTDIRSDIAIEARRGFGPLRSASRAMDSDMVIYPKVKRIDGRGVEIIITLFTTDTMEVYG